MPIKAGEGALCPDLIVRKSGPFVKKVETQITQQHHINEPTITVLPRNKRLNQDVYSLRTIHQQPSVLFGVLS